MMKSKYHRDDMTTNLGHFLHGVGRKERMIKYWA